MMTPCICATKRRRIYCGSADMGIAASELHVSCSTARDLLINSRLLLPIFSQVLGIILVPLLMTQ